MNDGQVWSNDPFVFIIQVLFAMTCLSPFLLITILTFILFRLAYRDMAKLKELEREVAKHQEELDKKEEKDAK